MSTRKPLASLLALICAGAALAAACRGTETDNPVAEREHTSPESFSPPAVIPPCPANSLAELPNVPVHWQAAALVPAPGGDVLAVIDPIGRLSLFASSSEPGGAPLARDVVRGAEQVFATGPGQLWVLAAEPPVLEPATVPSIDRLRARSRLLQLDVTDPTRPVRVSESEPIASAWPVTRRGDELWLLEARLAPEELRCDAPYGLWDCGYTTYAAVVLRGLALGGAGPPPIAGGELPFDRRAFWSGDGVATAFTDGTVHVLSWDGAGALRGPRTLQVAEGGVLPGPVHIQGDTLWVASNSGGEVIVHSYDLASDNMAPQRSFTLGAPPLYELPAPGATLSVLSLFHEGKLWLQSDFGAGAQVWDITGVEPAAVSLPLPFSTLLPVAGASHADAGGGVLAIGAVREPSGEETYHLVSVGAQARVLAQLEGRHDIGAGRRSRAPDGLRGSGVAPAWDLVSVGAGLPFTLEPSMGPQSETRVEALVGVSGPPANPEAPGVAEAALVRDYNFDGVPPTSTAELEVTREQTTTRFALPPATGELLVLGSNVVAIANDLNTGCDRTVEDCTRRTTGLTVFDVSAEPRRSADLPFPDLGLPATDDPNAVEVSWRVYDRIAQRDHVAFPLGARRVAFVAVVSLSCDTPERCAALELEAVPFREAGVAAATTIDCPPAEIDPSCEPSTTPLPTVYGMGQRQYFFVLDLDGADGPEWQAWGESRLESLRGQPERASRFARPITTDGVLAATRLEKKSRSGEWLPRGVARFMLDRFEYDPASGAVARPPVNIPGYAVMRLSSSVESERWLSIEPVDGENGHARVHHLSIEGGDARIEQTLPLEHGSFAGFEPLHVGDARLGVVLTAPADGCGTSQLSALRLSGDDSATSGGIELASALELPSDRWSIVASDGPRLLLRRELAYMLVEADTTGALHVISTRVLDASLRNEQLLGTTLRGAVGMDGRTRIDF